MRTPIRRTAQLIASAVAALLVAGCVGSPDVDSRLVSATVVRVVDGDTAVFRLAGGAEEKTRFIGVDTPESTNKIEEYGKEASAFTARVLTPGRDVYLERDVEERDRYGRLLAYVWLERPQAITDSEVRAKMFNAHLALEGYAQQLTIQPNSRYADLFTRYVREARSADKGLWGLGEQGGTAPASPSAQAPPGSALEASYVGNRKTKVFHRPGCGSVADMKASNRVTLSSRQQAVAEGFEPCGRCDP